VAPPATALRQKIQLFATLAPADHRPLKTFKAVEAARKWLATATGKVPA
jgi:hypothetical protein